jgi:hypothetical protein
MRWDRCLCPRLLGLQLPGNVGAAHFEVRSGQLTKVATDVLNGSAREVILYESDVCAVDLIVVGSHGYGFWGAQASCLQAVRLAKTAGKMPALPEKSGSAHK